MHSPTRLDVLLRNTAAKPMSPSPITPGGVTGIVYPSPQETEMDGASLSTRSTRLLRDTSGHSRSLRRTSKMLLQKPKPAPVEISETGSSGDVDVDDVWNAIRRQKEEKMAKEKSKVSSLEDWNKPPETSHSPRPGSSAKIPKSPLRTSTTSPPPHTPPAPTVAPTVALSAGRQRPQWLIEEFSDRDSFFQQMPAPKAPSVKAPTPPPTPPPPKRTVSRKKSVLSFKVRPDKDYVVAIFDLRGIDKEAIRISHNLEENEVTVSWELWECETWTEGECVVRQTIERLHYRLIQLADGVESKDIYAAMKNGDLLLRYPRFGANGTRSREA